MASATTTVQTSATRHALPSRTISSAANAYNGTAICPCADNDTWELTERPKHGSLWTVAALSTSAAKIAYAATNAKHSSRARLCLPENKTVG
jgi:hypothetical protein